MDDLVKRLRKVEPDLPGERTRWYRNPDGPEAADRIEQLEAALVNIWGWYPTNVSNPHETINAIKDYAFSIIKGGNEDGKAV